MTVKENSASTGTPGQPVTTDNSGGDFDTPFDVVSTSDSSVLTYTADGADTKFLVQITASSGHASMGWITWYETSDRVGYRFELEIASMPTNPVTLASIVRTGAYTNLDLILNSSGYLSLWEDGAYLFDFEAATLITGTVYRVEAVFGLGDPGSFVFKLFDSAAGTTPIIDEGSDPWTWSAPGNLYQSYFGSTSTGTNATASLTLNNLSINDTGDLPGPYTAPDAPSTVDAPPAEVGVDAPEPVVPVAIDIDAPAAQVAVQTPAPVVFVAVNVFVTVPTPADGYGQALTPGLIAATIVQMSPTDGGILPTLRPTFRIAVSTSDPAAKVQVQYDTGPTFPHPVTLTSDPVTTGVLTTYVTVPVTESLDDDASPWVWRVRVINDFDATPWSPTWSFDLSGPDGDALVGGTWTVSPTQVPTPHLWWVLPDRGRPGDEAVAIGTGFGPNTATISLSGVNAPGELRNVAHSAVAYSEDRTISRTPDMVDCDHQRVDFLVPPVSPPAGPLFVDGS